MKAILTLQNPDGTFDLVGMNNRSVLTGANPRTLKRKAEKLSAGRGWNLEIFYGDSILKKAPDLVYSCY